MSKKQPVVVSQVSSAETAILISLLQQVLAKNTAGDVVELGCYKGDTSILFQRELAKTFGSTTPLLDFLKKLGKTTQLPATNLKPVNSLSQSVKSPKSSNVKVFLFQKLKRLSLKT